MEDIYQSFSRLNNQIEEFLNNEQIYKHDLTNNINLETAKNLASDFFYYYDKDLYNYYNYLRGRGLIVAPGTVDEIEIIGGATLFTINNKNPFFVSDNKNLITAVSIVHETMHSYVMHKVLRNIKYDGFSNYLINNIDEVGPLLIELLFLEYLYKTGINKRDVEAMMYKNMDYYLNYSLDVKKLLEDIKEDLSDDQKKDYFEYVERNGLSFLYALIFFKKYLEDGDKDYIYSFHRDAINMSKRELFEKYDLSFDSLKDLSIIKKHGKWYYMNRGVIIYER